MNDALEGCSIWWNCCGASWPVAEDEVPDWCRTYQAAHDGVPYDSAH